MLLERWALAWTALRSGGESALQMKHLGAKLLWKQVQIVFTSKKLGEVNASKGAKQCTEITYTFSLLGFHSKMGHLLSKYTNLRLVTYRPGLLPSVNSEVKTS